MKSYGRHVYGWAVIGFGVIALVWRNFNNWQQIRPLGNIPHRAALACLMGAIEIADGAAVQWRRTARSSAVMLRTLIFVFALLWVPNIAAKPLVYDN